MDVVLIDSTQELAEKGKAYSAKLLAKDVERGKRTQEQAAAILAKITPTTDYAQLAGAQLVIEAVFEKREIKADVTAKTEAVIAKDAIFASNTSTLPITGLAKASKRPKNFIGIHFFSPVEKMPLVEIIVGKQTSDEAIARALDYVGQLRKTPIVVNDSRGFYTSRCFGTYPNEGAAMVAEGIDPQLIESAGRLAGMPVGPLAVSDEVSLELSYKVMLQSRADLGAKYKEPASWPVVRHFVEDLGRLGRKSGAGYYDYPEGGKKTLWAGLAQEYPRLPRQPGRGRTQDPAAVHPGARDRALLRGRRAEERARGRPGVDPRLGFPGLDRRHAVVHRHRGSGPFRRRVQAAGAAVRRTLQADQGAARAGAVGWHVLRRRRCGRGAGIVRREINE